jgi:hypothetical protein
MSSILIKNIGTLVTGKLESPLRNADSILVQDGVINATGSHQELCGTRMLLVAILNGEPMRDEECFHVSQYRSGCRRRDVFASDLLADFQFKTFRDVLHEAYIR